jgi:hypothetical protein
MTRKTFVEYIRIHIYHLNDSLWCAKSFLHNEFIEKFPLENPKRRNLFALNMWIQSVE